MSLELAHNNVIGQLYVPASLQAYKNKVDRKKLFGFLLFRLHCLISLSSIFPINTITGLF